MKQQQESTHPDRASGGGGRAARGADPCPENTSFVEFEECLVAWLLQWWRLQHQPGSKLRGGGAGCAPRGVLSRRSLNSCRAHGDHHARACLRACARVRM
eukprot:gene9409-biopygen3213